MAPVFPSSLPEPSADQVYVTISALESGQLTLPERLFVTDADPDKRTTVPSLSFLIQHPSPGGHGRPMTNLVFDLGVKRDVKKYPDAMQTHIKNRQPTIHHPDTADSLREGGLDPATGVDIVILSHVHWDHVGTPEDFSTANFVVGSGTIHLLENGAPPHYPKEIFDPDLLPRDRTKELPPVGDSNSTAYSEQTQHLWGPFASFAAAIDFFGDGSVYIVDTPGHLFGHVNLLVRIEANKWVYLGGDCCHDVRILTGEKDVALYDDGHGSLRSVHVDTEAAQASLKRIRPLMPGGELLADGVNQVEVVVAHDAGWRQKNSAKFWPGTF